MWRSQYSQLLNSSQSQCHKTAVLDHLCDGAQYKNINKFYCSIKLVRSLLLKLPLNKSAGVDKLSAKHLRFCDPIINVYLSLYYNMCLKHGYIPSNCLDTVIIPTLKNINGNIDNPNNFCPIAIATILSKLFKHIILDICSKVFKTCDNQFGFKAKVSSDMCVFTLKQLISSYHKQGSPVYCAFLDASKAFDRVNHYMLFKKIIERNMPTCFVRILYYWYSKQNMKVKWGNCLSSPFSVSNGVRQGGVVSPYLFALYIDDLSVKLNCVKAGCFLGNSRLNHIIYADDLCCFSPSLDGLQDLLNVRYNYAVEHDITFNCCKSVGVLFLPKYLSLSNVPKVFLCNNVVKFKNNVKYLGVFLNNNNLKDDDDICLQVRYLYGKSNQLKTTFSKCSRTIKIYYFIITVLRFMLVVYGQNIYSLH